MAARLSAGSAPSKPIQKNLPPVSRVPAAKVTITSPAGTKVLNPVVMSTTAGKVETMGMGSLLSGGMKAIGAVARSPIGKAASFIPGIGTAVSAIGMGATAYGAYSAIKGTTGQKGMGGLPALPGMAPMRGGQMTLPSGSTGGFGIPRGPGGKMQLPWNDPSTPAYLKQFALDDSTIRIMYRAPRGYVIVRDASGRPFPLLKKIAMQFGLWHPAKKPPISVRDWQALKRADRAIHKMKKIVTMTTRIDSHVGKGGKVHFTKHKAHK